MAHLDSILAITDFSLGARYAVARSAHLAKELGVERIAALHVVERGVLDGLRRLFGGANDLPEPFEAGARQTLERLLKDVAEATGCVLEPLVKSGRTLEAVLDAAEAFGLLVVGARGQHKKHRLALGTTSRALLRAHTEPVLLVRTPVDEGYRRVMVAMDFSDYSKRALDWARTLAPEAALHLIHVFDNPSPRSASYMRVSHEGLAKFRRRLLSKTEQKMAALVEDIGPLPTASSHRVVVGDPASSLLEQAAEVEADLLVIGKHARPPTEQFLLGSVTLRVLDDSVCDVLVVQ
ncbi:MAG: universal stress protein [Gammaproteobacteria bacterium]|nr:MAG: universal stress protein [Gammaproteobacteria bacterium]